MPGSELAGRCYVNTRPLVQAEELSLLLRAHGAEVIEFPALEIVPCAEPQTFGAEFAELKEGDWLLFTSANAVRAAGDWLLRHSAGRHRHCGAIGRKTAEALSAAGLVADFVAAESNSAGFAREFLSFIKSGDFAQVPLRVLLLRGDIAGDELPFLISGAGISVVQLVVYSSRLPQVEGTQVAELSNRLGTSAVHGFIFTSSQAIRNFLAILLARLTPDKGAVAQSVSEGLLAVPCFVIGPKTAATARETGFSRIMTSQRASAESLVELILAEH